ncbi:MAG: hypothetical protein A3J52_00330 [Omnitrophica bacterium RIFCSPHIGHO2_02_FULL_49_9]|nr:MAG: hypothetical protein A3J52_00330 [Omnitrophica bacterium RIFCSPHIGHO2_02_FULL_49_9]OGW89980.1 MAG: hypothetical protein A3A73_04230 [Omnitrophica bacterium RIFCSPLOWO2_01_FULL_50_24]
MSRTILLLSLLVGLGGTGTLGVMGKSSALLGWWIGVGLGLFNYFLLLKSVRRLVHERSREPDGGKGKSLGIAFFLRYLVLAAGFFLTFRLGREQLISCFISFVALYAVLFLDYLVRSRRQKPV